VPVQRCLIHVHRNNLPDLTSKPNTAAGKALLALSQRLLKVSTKDEAATWVKLLIQINTEYGDYLTQRTWAKDVPADQRREGPDLVVHPRTQSSLSMRVYAH
jgi:hypothetical protein